MLRNTFQKNFEKKNWKRSTFHKKVCGKSCEMMAQINWFKSNTRHSGVFEIFFSIKSASLQNNASLSNRYKLAFRWRWLQLKSECALSNHLQVIGLNNIKLCIPGLKRVLPLRNIFLIKRKKTANVAAANYLLKYLQRKQIHETFISYHLFVMVYHILTYALYMQCYI